MDLIVIVLLVLAYIMVGLGFGAGTWLKDNPLFPTSTCRVCDVLSGVFWPFFALLRLGVWMATAGS